MDLSLLIPVGCTVGGVLLVVLALLSTWKKVPTDKAGIVTGLGKAKVITGGGTVVIPVFQRMDYITLENISFVVDMPGTLTADAVPVVVTGNVVVKIKNEEGMIRSAVEQFNCGREDETKDHIMETARDVCEGRLREIIADMTAEQLYKDRKGFSEKVQEVAAAQLTDLGLELKSFTIKSIDDENGYFQALSAPRIAAVKRDATVAQAEADRESKVKTSEATRAGEQARLESEARIAEAAKNAEVQQLEYAAESQTAKANSDAAYEIQQNITKQKVTATEMDAAVLRAQREREVAEATLQIEIGKEAQKLQLAKKQAETAEATLLSSKIKPAEAEAAQRKIEADAQKEASIRAAEAVAEKAKLDAEAEARRIELEGKAEAAKIAAIGAAQADATRQLGLAEAEALEKKAEALSKMDEAGRLQMVMDKLPEIARAVAEPMAKIGNITIIGGGGENSGGASDVAHYTVGALKAVTEALKDTVGFDLTEVMRAQTYAGCTDVNLHLTDARNKQLPAEAEFEQPTSGKSKTQSGIILGESLVLQDEPEINKQVMTKPKDFKHNKGGVPRQGS